MSVVDRASTSNVNDVKQFSPDYRILRKCNMVRVSESRAEATKEAGPAVLYSSLFTSIAGCDQLQ